MKFFKPETRSALLGGSLFLTLYLCSGHAQDRLRLPRFEDYSVTEVFTGKPATPKLVTPQDQSYADQIRDGVENGYGVFRDSKEQKGPNFAGNLIVIQWGCGAPCLRMAVVDARTGEVHYPPISFEGVGKPSFDLPLLAPDQSVGQNPEIQFRPNSSLMVIRATPNSNQPSHPSYTFYFQWKQNGWTLVRKVPFTRP
jgi:hypothetical protein